MFTPHDSSHGMCVPGGLLSTSNMIGAHHCSSLLIPAERTVSFTMYVGRLASHVKAEILQQNVYDFINCINL